MAQLRLLVALSSLLQLLSAQTPSPTTNTTRGACSPAVSGNNNTFTINCQGLSKEQSQEFLAVLKKLTSNSLDSKVVMEMLDELIANTRDLKKGVKEIRQQQEGRRLSDESLSLLVEKLRSVTVRVPVTVTIVNGTPESLAFGESIDKAFTAAGWKSRISSAIGAANGILRGQTISVRRPDNQAAFQVQNIFKAVGVELGGKLSSQIKDDSIDIDIHSVP